jgi:hypothetical protein
MEKFSVYEAKQLATINHFCGVFFQLPPEKKAQKFSLEAFHPASIL